MHDRLAQKIAHIALQQTREKIVERHNFLNGYDDSKSHLCKIICNQRPFNHNYLNKNQLLTEKEKKMYCDNFIDNRCYLSGTVHIWGIENGPRWGSELLEEIFKTALWKHPDYIDIDKDSKVAEFSEIKFRNKFHNDVDTFKEDNGNQFKKSGWPGQLSWCGIFATWVWIKAGLNKVYWGKNEDTGYGEMIIKDQPGAVRINNTGKQGDEKWSIEDGNIIGSKEEMQKFVKGPGMGDICFIKSSNQHICVLTHVVENNGVAEYYAVNGNSYNGGITNFYTTPDKVRHVFYKESEILCYNTVIDPSYERWKANDKFTEDINWDKNKFESIGYEDNAFEDFLMREYGN